MRFCIKKSAIIAAAIVSPATARASVSVIVPVGEDESVVSAFPDKNYGDNGNRGGLFVGADGTGMGVSRFYLKFALPQAFDPQALQKATLRATYEDDLDRTDNGLHRIHFVAADDWHENTITWANQPGPTFGSSEATFDAATAKLGAEQSWDLTDLVRGELKGDHTLSLMFAAANESVTRENRNWEYFAEKEFNPAQSFQLVLNGAGAGRQDTAVVPLPPALVPAVLTLAGLAGRSMLKRRRLAAG